MGVQTTSDKDVQSIGTGVGPRFHRTYWVEVPVSWEQAVKTMEAMKADINAYSPQAIATFEKQSGDPKDLSIGDEILVRITGPWNGPVRVTEVRNDGFSFCTLEGHLEAGSISFRISKTPRGTVCFKIESITRSRDQIVNFFYDKLRLAMLAQTEMWELFCQNFARDALNDPEVRPVVHVQTRRQDPETGLWEDVSDQLGTHGSESKVET